MRFHRNRRTSSPRKRGALYCFCVGGAVGVLCDVPFYLMGVSDEAPILLFGSVCLLAYWGIACYACRARRLS